MMADWLGLYGLDLMTVESGWVDGGMGGWVDGWMGGWVDGACNGGCASVIAG